MGSAYAVAGAATELTATRRATSQRLSQITRALRNVRSQPFWREGAVALVTYDPPRAQLHHPPARSIDHLSVVGRHDDGHASPVDLRQQLDDLPRSVRR